MNESINTILNTVTRISTNTEAIRNVTSDQSRLIDDTSDKILKVNDSNSSIIRTISENKEKTISLRKKAEEIAVEIGTNWCFWAWTDSEGIRYARGPLFSFFDTCMKKLALHGIVGNVNIEEGAKVF